MAKNNRKVKLDFSNVETYVKCAEGQHIVKLIELDETTSAAGNDMYTVVFEVTKGQSKGAKLYENFVLTEKALWKFKNYLEAVGVRCEGRLTVNLDSLLGKTCIVDVRHEEYEGKIKARIDNFKRLAKSTGDDDDDDYDADEEDEDEPTPAAKQPKKKNKKPEPVEDDEDDEDWEDEDEPAPPKKKKKSAPPAAKKKKKPAPPVDDDDDDDWDDEDDDD